jgi:hypothetical protein
MFEQNETNFDRDMETEIDKADTEKKDISYEERLKQEIERCKSILMQQGSGFYLKRYQVDPASSAPLLSASMHHGYLSVKLGQNEYCVTHLKDNPEASKLVYDELQIPDSGFYIPESI